MNTIGDEKLMHFEIVKKLAVQWVLVLCAERAIRCIAWSRPATAPMTDLASRRRARRAKICGVRQERCFPSPVLQPTEQPGGGSVKIELKIEPKI